MKNRFSLYFAKVDLKRQGEEGGSNIGESLLKKAVACFGAPNLAEKGVFDYKLKRTAKGKPYFEDSNIYFSISHSDDLWACLVGDFNCGLDVQYMRPCNFEKIAGRFYSKNEALYVKAQGLEGFYNIWTMREAYGKITGEGFWGDMPEFVTDDGQPADMSEVTLHHIELPGEDNLKVCLCLPIGGEVGEIRELT